MTSYTSSLKTGIWITVLIVGVLALGTILMQHTGQKEGFATTGKGEDVENPLTPQQFSYGLLTSVMKPIRRLSSQLMDVGIWKERFEMAKMTPTELARRHLQSIQTPPATQ
jgi:hypothetical protein